MAKAENKSGIVSLDVESNVQTLEGRIFLKQLNEVSHVLHLKDTEVKFFGEEIARLEYVGDYKSIILYQCPRGYFLFFDRAIGKNNWSLVGQSIDEIIDNLSDEEVKTQLQEKLAVKEKV